MKTNTKKYNINGFSLLELIVSIAIIGLLSIVIVQTFITTSRSNTKTEVLKEVKQNGDFVIGSMERMIRSARAITSACPTSGFSQKFITFTANEGQDVAYGCDDTSGYPLIASASALGTMNLVSSNAQLVGNSCSDADISFTCTSYDYQSPTVEIQFSLSQTGVPQSNFEKATVSFQTSVNVRN